MNDTQSSSSRRRVHAALLSLLFLLGAAGPVLAVDGVIEINQASAGGSTVFISVSGSYRLTSNLQAPVGLNGVKITADHVTLDLNGFSIIGVIGGAIADGIGVSASDVEIRNGTVQSFSRHGVFSNFDFVRVIGVRAIGSQTRGIELQGAGNIVNGCTVTSNVVGGIRAGDGSIIMNSVVQQNGGLGLVMNPTTGYLSNTVTLNNGGNTNPQTNGSGIQLGSNICGTDLVCP